MEHFLQDCVFAYTLAQHDENTQDFYATIHHCKFLWKKILCSSSIIFKVKPFTFIFTLRTLPILSLIKHHLSSNIILKPFFISYPTLRKLSMSDIYNKSEMYFKLDRLFIATIPLPLTII